MHKSVPSTNDKKKKIRKAWKSRRKQEKTGETEADSFFWKHQNFIKYISSLESGKVLSSTLKDQSTSGVMTS